MLLDELLVARQLTHGIVGQHANEQRGCGKALLSAAGVDLGLEGVTGSRRCLRQVVDDVKLGCLNICADGKRQVHVSRAAADK